MNDDYGFVSGLVDGRHRDDIDQAIERAEQIERERLNQPVILEDDDPPIPPTRSTHDPYSDSITTGVVVGHGREIITDQKPYIPTITVKD